MHVAIAVQNHQAKLNGMATKKVELASKDDKPLIPITALRYAPLELEVGE